MLQTTDILILGGGASGLAAAVTAKRIAPNLHITILEHNDKVGKKLLVTGNGRCNLGNAALQTNAYCGTVSALLPRILSETDRTEDFFRSMGLFCRKDTEGRLYPRSNQAASVLDTLRLTCDQLHVESICNCEITALRHQKTSFSVNTTKGSICAGTVICASGGLAAPKTGSDGSCFPFLRSLGHCISPCQPALVPFETDLKLTRPLKGVRLTAAVSACSPKGECLFCETGEVQFNECTISGICVMNLSAKCINQIPAYLSLNLLPGYSVDQIAAMLWELYAVRTDWKLENFFTGLFPKKAALSLLRYAGISLPLDTAIYQLTPLQIEQLTACCQDWRFPIRQRKGWQEAQVMAGGISLNEIDEKLQSRRINGLFFAGEILDIHGICGGYNLEWAWHSGQYAAMHAVQSLSEENETI